MNPVLKKMNFKNQSPVLIADAPVEITGLLSEPGIEFHDSIQQKYEFIAYFAYDKSGLEKNIGRIVDAWVPDTLFWICYPKGTSKKYKSDLYRDNIWEFLKPRKLRPVSMVAIDNDWSAMRIRPGN